MNKMMLTPGTGSGRTPAADLLSQLAAPRTSQDGEASAAFARLLQAKGGTLSAGASPMAPAAPRTLGSPNAEQGNGMPPAPTGPAARPAPAPAAGAAAGAEAPKGAAPNDQARRQEAARTAGRRSAEAQAKGVHGPSPDGPDATDPTAPQDPVLAQVLRHLRKDEGPAETEERLEDAEDIDADDAAATDPSLASPLAQAQDTRQLPSTLPAGPSAIDAGPADAGALTRNASPRIAPDEDGGAAGAVTAEAKAGDPVGGLRPQVTPATLQAAADRAAPANGAALALDAAAREGLAQRTGETGKTGPGALSDPSQPGGAFAGLLQQVQAGTVQERSSAAGGAGARYELHSPLHDKGFAPEMAARLSLAAAEGVQQAQLHLNPAEMGPVQVQIVLDGQQAQISFVAEQADTRAVLEKSLPELAGALREQGLTLSGGGVFSQQQQSQSGQPGQADRDSGAAAGRWASSGLDTASADEAATRQRGAVSSRRSRGVLDLFA